MQNTKEIFKVERIYNAPKELVFKAFSEVEALKQWWGPVEMPISALTLDFKVGGKFHYKMEGHGNVMWGVFVYQKINPFDEISYISSFSNEKAEVCKAPFDMDFPLEIHNEMTFSEADGKTTLSLQSHPYKATEAQTQTFFAISENMNKGFHSTFDQLEKYLG